VDEDTNDRVGFGRIRHHKVDDGEVIELTGLGVLEDWRGQGVGAHVVERLVENTHDEGFEELYAFVDRPQFLEALGFERIDESDLPDPLIARLREKRDSVEPDAVPLRLDIEQFVVPARFREAFKEASPEGEPEKGEADETAEDFGIDPETATYKYDTGR
ncbi:MAG: GNAT family N-acetyltransferase, partial [Halobacteriales archaeon]|nr:GNAT family N-acetyltransferase [Halobacteriales archaeon]